MCHCCHLSFHLFNFSIISLAMKQVNVTTGKERPIKRALHSATDFR